MFFPEKGEILFNVYNTQNSLAPRQLYRRRFVSGLSDEWVRMDLDQTNSAGSAFDFAGMFRFNGKAYAMDKSVNNVYELLWNEKDQIELKKVVRDFFCEFL